MRHKLALPISAVLLMAFSLFVLGACSSEGSEYASTSASAGSIAASTTSTVSKDAQIAQRILDNAISAKSSGTAIEFDDAGYSAQWLKGLRASDGVDPFVMMPYILIHNESLMGASGNVYFFVAFFDNNDRCLSMAPIIKSGRISNIDNTLAINNFSDFASKTKSSTGSQPKKCQAFVASIQISGSKGYVLFNPDDLRDFTQLDIKDAYQLLIESKVPSTDICEIEVLDYGFTS